MSGYVSKKRDARTTQRQYEMMLDFMIKHPDIASGRHANTKRANYEKHWEELAAVLNSDTAGPSKATTKWMKCWSDWKHNTRTKSAKIRQFKETSTDGRFPCLLTSLEERLLKLMATFKAEATCEPIGWKQEERYEFENQDISDWFAGGQFNIKPEINEAEEDASDTSDDEVQFNTVADFCIPVIAQEESGVGEPVTNNFHAATWKKRKRSYSEESTHSQESQQVSIKLDNNDELVGDISIKESLGRIAVAVERSAVANERCADACERLAQLYERVKTACERSASANEKLLLAQERNALTQDKMIASTDELQKTAQRQVDSCEELVGIVRTVTEQSMDILKRYVSQNNIRR